jgi:hypothetical protein
VLGEPLQRVREVLPDEALPDPESRDRRLAQDEVEDLVQKRLTFVDVDAASRDLDRGRHNIAPRQTSVPAVDFFQSRRRPRDRAGTFADAEVLVLVPRERHGDLFGGGPCSARNGDEEVQQSGHSRCVHEHEAAAARPRERALGDP